MKEETREMWERKEEGTGFESMSFSIGILEHNPTVSTWIGKTKLYIPRQKNKQQAYI